MVCLCVAGCALQAGLESKSVLPAIADLYVQERLAVLPRTASYGPGKCVRLAHGMVWSRSVLGCVVSFSLQKMRVRAWKWHCFLWLAPKRRSQKSFLCTHRVRCAGVLCKLACTPYLRCAHTACRRARQAGLESKSDLWVICIQEIQARAAESVRSARCAPVKLYECSVSIIGSVAGKRVRSVWI